MGTSVPSAISGLLALWSSSISLAGIDVRDALSLPEESSDKALWVGWQDPAAVAAGNAVDNAIELTSQVAGYGPREQEAYLIHCAAGAVNGNSDYQQARIDVAGIYDAARAAVAASRDLGGAIQGQAVCAQGSLRYEDLSDLGIKAMFMFDVAVTAYST